MLASFARKFEICFFAPSYASEGSLDDSNQSENRAPEGATKWYNRVPSGNNRMQDYVIGDYEDDELAPL